jgi:Flp pilus assembly protein TadG
MIRSTQRRKRRGGVLIEMAFISCICLAFMFAIFEYGRVVMMQQIMANASRAGARLAVVTATSYTDHTADTNAVKALVMDQLASLPLTQVNVQVYLADDTGNNIGDWTTAQFGQKIIVQVDADCPNLFPTGVPTGIPKAGGPSVMVNFLPNSSTTTPNAVHLTAMTMMCTEAN